MVLVNRRTNYKSIIPMLQRVCVDKDALRRHVSPLDTRSKHTLFFQYFDKLVWLMHPKTAFLGDMERRWSSKTGSGMVCKKSRYFFDKLYNFTYLGNTLQLPSRVWNKVNS
jgi:hypothetical protein